MITPEDYYLNYKKISSLFNEKYIYAISVTIVIPVLILLYFMQTSKFLVIILIIYIFALYKFLQNSANWIKNEKINKLKKLTDDKDITSDNFNSKYQDHVLINLKTILNKNNINYKIYNSFYRSHLNNYLNVNKNILGNNVYVSFIFGSIYVGTLQAFYNLSATIEDLIVVLCTIVIISLFIIWILHEIKQFTHNKYIDISKLIFYTEMIFQEQEK
jgi:hypothetical protein